jgi:hypothetical protein
LGVELGESVFLPSYLSMKPGLGATGLK